MGPEFEPDITESFERAASALESGDLQAAESVYAAAVDRNPQHVRALTGLALVALKRGLPEEALGHLSAAAALRPHDRRLVQWMTQTIERVGGAPESTLERLLEQRPESSAIAFGLAALSLGKDADTAGRWLAHLWRLEVDDPDAWINRGLARWWTGDLHSAIREFDKAATLSPESPEPYANRGEVYCGLEEYAAALTDFEKVASSHRNRALACGDAATSTR